MISVVFLVFSLGFPEGVLRVGGARGQKSLKRIAIFDFSKVFQWILEYFLLVFLGSACDLCGFSCGFLRFS